jgi:hypothetical protein
VRSAQDNAVLNPATSTAPRTVSSPSGAVACAIGDPRGGPTFRSIRVDPLIAPHYDTSLGLLSINFVFLMKPAEQKGRRRYAKGGVGERLWSLGEEASNPRRESKCALHEIQAAP